MTIAELLLPEVDQEMAITRRVLETYGQLFLDDRERFAALPPTQRTVISLRDVEGWSADEVCNALTLTETNQRVLLHRARSTVRAALEQYLQES